MSHLRIQSAIPVLVAATVLWIGHTVAQETGRTASGRAASNSATLQGSDSIPSRSSISNSTEDASEITATFDAALEFVAGDSASSATAAFRTKLDDLRQAEQHFVRSTRELVAKYQATTEPSQREAIRNHLHDVLTEHFEVRQQIRARDLEELETQVHKLRELHQRREQEKGQIVGDRLKQLLRDAEGLGWGAGDAAPVGDAAADPRVP